MKHTLALLPAVALALAGCSTIEKDATYGTVESLGKAVSEVLDIDCGKGTGKSAAAGWDQDTCGDKAVIGVFTNGQTQREVLAKNPSNAQTTIVEGPNWAVWAKEGKASEIQDKLGGKIVEPPKLFTGVINLELAPISPDYLARPEGGTMKSCFANRLSPYKDLGEDSSASVTTSSGLVLEGKLASSDLSVDACLMRYEIPEVPAGDGPYKIVIGNRTGPDQSEQELESGAELTIGR